MRTELPEFKRCCCCIPLRYGLLGWTYIRMVYLLPMIIILITSINMFINGDYQYRSTTQTVLQSITLVSLLLDVAFNIVFLIGGHTKNVKLLKVQYYYNMVTLGLYGVLTFIMIGIMVFQNYRFYLLFHFGFMMLLTNVCLFIIGFVMQFYILLLTRSEIRKLSQDAVGFRFANRAAEAQCVVDVEDKTGFIDPDHEDVPAAL